MATTVSSIFRNKVSESTRLVRCLARNSMQICRLSAQAQQPAINEPVDAECDRVRIDPLRHPDYFQVRKLFTLQDLFDARVHYGHKEGTLNNKMIPFIYGSRLGHLIIDLDQTVELLREALNFTAHIAYNNGIILMVARKPQYAHLVEKTAKECKEFAHTRNWNNGTFTNSIKEFNAITRLPDLCIFFNTLNDVMQEHQGVRDAAKLNIPSVGIVDTNCNPNLITYPVPGNDDSPSSVELYCKLFKQAILLGKEARARDKLQT